MLKPPKPTRMPNDGERPRSRSNPAPSVPPRTASAKSGVAARDTAGATRQASIKAAAAAPALAWRGVVTALREEPDSSLKTASCTCRSQGRPGGRRTVDPCGRPDHSPAGRAGLRRRSRRAARSMPIFQLSTDRDPVCCRRRARQDVIHEELQPPLALVLIDVQAIDELQ